VNGKDCLFKAFEISKEIKSFLKKRSEEPSKKIELLRFVIELISPILLCNPKIQTYFVIPICNILILDKTLNFHQYRVGELISSLYIIQHLNSKLNIPNLLGDFKKNKKRIYEWIDNAILLFNATQTLGNGKDYVTVNLNENEKMMLKLHFKSLIFVDQKSNEDTCVDLFYHEIHKNLMYWFFCM